MHQLETLLENTIDKNFDKLEIYTLRNVLTVPEDLVPWVRLEHYNVSFLGIFSPLTSIFVLLGGSYSMVQLRLLFNHNLYIYLFLPQGNMVFNPLSRTSLFPRQIPPYRPLNHYNFSAANYKKRKSFTPHSSPRKPATKPSSRASAPSSPHHQPPHTPHQHKQQRPKTHHRADRTVAAAQMQARSRS